MPTTRKKLSEEPSPGTVVVVWWTDSAMHPDYVVSADDPSLGPIEAVSAGMLVREDQRSVTLAIDSWETGDFRTLQTIYKRQIDHIERIEL